MEKTSIEKIPHAYLSHPVPNLSKIVGESFVLEEKKYFISKKIGSGMSGSTFLCLEDGEKKLLLKVFQNTEKAKNEFYNGVKCLRHVLSICEKGFLCLYQVFDLEINPKQTRKCMLINFLEEYLNYSDFVKFSKPSKQVLQNIKDRILELIQQLHELDLAHSDIQPSNIMVHPDTLDVHIIDFDKCVITKQRDVFRDTFGFDIKSLSMYFFDPKYTEDEVDVKEPDLKKPLRRSTE
jgi:serine/threonine protein kinase